MKKNIAEISNNVALFFIRSYIAFFSGIFGGSCRFYPSCSQYGEEAFKNYNFLAALRLTFFRLMKCYPFGPKGFDPLPEIKERQCLHYEAK